MACRLLMGRMGWRCYQLQPQPQLLLPQPKRSSQPQPLLFQPPPMMSSRMMIHHMLSQPLSQPQPLLPQPPMTSSRMMIHHQLFPFQLFHISFNASLINKRHALFYDIVRRIDFLCAGIEQRIREVRSAHIRCMNVCVAHLLEKLYNCFFVGSFIEER